MKLLRKDGSSRYFGKAVAGAALCLAAVAGEAGIAKAGFDGQNPNGCSGNQSPIGQTALNVNGVTRGYVELRFSTGCGIAWSRVCRDSTSTVSLHRITRFQPANHQYTTAARAGSAGGTCNNNFGSATAHSYGAIDANCTTMWGIRCLATATGTVTNGGAVSNVGPSGPY